MLEDFPIVIEIPVAWGEMDSYQHVNNVVYFKYFESARIAYGDRVGLIDYKLEHDIGPILAYTDCRFRAALTYPDTVLAGATVSEIGSDRFTMLYAIASQEQNRIVAEGSGRIVMYDYRNDCKTDLPDIIRERIEKLQSR